MTLLATSMPQALISYWYLMLPIAFGIIFLIIGRCIPFVGEQYAAESGLYTCIGSCFCSWGIPGAVAAVFELGRPAILWTAGVSFAIALILSFVWFWRSPIAPPSAAPMADEDVLGT